MSDLSIKEKLQPSLLDRLIDNEPHQKSESREARAVTLKIIRESVLRDLNWLFNTENLETVHALDKFENVSNSVLNYGLPSVSGNTPGALRSQSIEQQVRRTILKFEPRILKETLSVKATLNTNEFSKSAFVLEITGDLWAQPIPLQLYLHTEIDIETGNVQVKSEEM